ncbi:MAG: tetratricopeptide repeat protein, partial [Desulfobulbaceae bacterium]|nr:tetratricopeptide repeat protein [Desulfobulbaceae bacterium]
MARKRNDKEEKLSRKQRRALLRADAAKQEEENALATKSEGGVAPHAVKKIGVEPAALVKMNSISSPAAVPAGSGKEAFFASSWQYLSVALLLIVVAVSYGNTFHSPFLLDDIGYVASDKIKAISNLSISSLMEAGFGGGSKTRWLVNISFAINRYLSGMDKWGFHLVNLAVHLSSVLMVYLVSVTTLTLPRLGYSRRHAMLIGLLAAGLWGANPVQTNAVTYIVQRMTSMATLFFMASLLCYVKGRIAGRHRALLFAASLVLGFLAFGCKEISATLPVVILAYELYFLRDTDKPLLSRNILIVSLLIFVLPVLLAFFSTGGNFISWITKEYSRYNFTLGERLLTEPRVVIFYLSLFFLPLPSRLNLLHDFSVSHSLFDPVQTVLAILGILLLVAVGVISFKRHRLLSFAIFWYFINLAIESSFIALDLIFEHRLYLPTIFLSLFLAVEIFKLLKAKTIPFLLTGLLCVVVLSGLTWQRNKAFASAVSFWSDVTEKSPRMANGYQGLYTALRAEGRLKEARTNLQKAFEVDPTHPQTAYDLAVLYRDDGSPSRALEVMNQSLKATMSSKGQGLMTNFILNNVQLRGNLYLNAEKFI